MAKSTLRTIIYIDGFNFYYGQLKDSPHKWLDLTSLFKTALQLIKEQHQKVIGLITPGTPKRKPSWQLKKYANFIVPLIAWALEKSLLPNVIPNTEIRKPDSW